MSEFLNPAQRLAVEHGDGPLLVLAGAGTGKTRTLTCRIAHLLNNRLLQPEQIMAVTFNRKAAHEMASRLATLLQQPALAAQVRLGTFHALSGSLLRNDREDPSRLRLLCETEQLAMVRQILGHQGAGGPDWQPLEVTRQISLAKGSLVDPKQLSSTRPELAAVYREYQQRLQEKGLLDFDDLIVLLLERWQQKPGLLARHQSLFRAILVDEFQDVNEAQYRWLRTLAGAHGNLWVVGDADQAIYGFRGSDANIFLRFLQDFPQAPVVKLEQSYRCSQRIVAAAAAVIANNANPLTCNLWSATARGPRIRLVHLASEEEEARFVVAEIERLLGGSSHYQIYRGRDADSPEEMQLGFADIAILYRTHAQSRPLAHWLGRCGIPYQVVGQKVAFATEGAEALLSYLRFALDTSRLEDLEVIFNLPPRGLGEQARRWLAKQLDRGLTPWEVLQQGARSAALPQQQRAAIKGLGETVSSLQELLARRPLSEALERAAQETGLQRHLAARSASEAEALRWLLLLAGSHGQRPAAESLPAFLEDLSQWRAADFFDARADAVTLMTMHAAKGLEFPVVFICGLEQDLIPWRRQKLEPQPLEEERRLFYVAMTRACHLLVLCSSRRRFLHGEMRTSEPSPFLGEIPSDLLEEVSPKGRRPRRQKQLSLF